MTVYLSGRCLSGRYWLERAVTPSMDFFLLPEFTISRSDDDPYYPEIYRRHPRAFLPYKYQKSELWNVRGPSAAQMSKSDLIVPAVNPVDRVRNVALRT
jgi:hypothetical protein